MNSHCWAITCTGSFLPLGTVSGLGPEPEPAPSADSRRTVPKTATPSTMIEVTMIQVACTRAWPRTAGPSSIWPLGWRKKITE